VRVITIHAALLFLAGCERKSITTQVQAWTLLGTDHRNPKGLRADDAICDGAYLVATVSTPVT